MELKLASQNLPRGKYFLYDKLLRRFIYLEENKDPEYFNFEAEDREIVKIEIDFDKKGVQFSVLRQNRIYHIFE